MISLLQSWFKLEAEGNKKSLKSIFGDHLKYIQTESSLVIKAVTLKDEATYLCFVNNSSGQKKVEIELTIEGEPRLYLLFTVYLI